MSRVQYRVVAAWQGKDVMKWLHTIEMARLAQVFGAKVEMGLSKVLAEQDTVITPRAAAARYLPELSDNAAYRQCRVQPKWRSTAKSTTQLPRTEAKQPKIAA
jgi:hypothetical protein